MGFTLLSGFEHEFILFKEGTKKPAHSRNDFMTTSTAARHVSHSQTRKGSFTL